MKAMLNWLRLVLPPGWVIGGFGLAYVGVDLLVLCVALPGRAWPNPERWLSWNVLLWGYLAYGIFRAVAFHPVLRPDYRRWMQSTPWTPRHALPLGPVHLVWQDLLVMALVELLAMRYPGFHPLRYPLVFLIPYLFALLAVLPATGQVPAAYAIGFGLGGVLLILPNLQLAAGIVMVLYGIAYLAIRRSLKKFPWDTAKIEQAIKPGFSQDAMRQGQLGWPFERLKPKWDQPCVSPLHGTLLSLLGGWWFAVLGTLLGSDQELSPFTPLAVGLCVMARIFAYCQGHWPPIGLWGRIFTLRWIIPAYDQVFAAPILTIGSAVATYELGERFHWSSRGVDATAVFLALWITLNLGPTLRSFTLTGSFRLTPAFRNRQEYVEV